MVLDFSVFVLILFKYIRSVFIHPHAKLAKLDWSDLFHTEVVKIYHLHASKILRESIFDADGYAI